MSRLIILMAKEIQLRISDNNKRYATAFSDPRTEPQPKCQMSKNVAPNDSFSVSHSRNHFAADGRLLVTFTCSALSCYKKLIEMHCSPCLM